MNTLTLALLLSGTQAASIFTDAQKKTFCVAAKHFTTTTGRSTCTPDTAKGQAESGATVVDVTSDAARSYTTACARRCLNDLSCLGFQSTEPADDGTGGACKTFKQSAQKWGTSLTGSCQISSADVADDSGNAPSYPTTNVQIGYTDKDLAACKAACLAQGANCLAIQHENLVCKILKKTGTYASSGSGTKTCIPRVAATAEALVRKDSVDAGTDKTMCYSKTTPGAAAQIEVETGFAQAFATAAKAAVATAIASSSDTTWYDAIEKSRSADQQTVASVAGITAAEKQNFDDEFIMAWAMLLDETFNTDNEMQKKFWADIKLTTGTNPLGTEFGTIYSKLTDKTKADTAIKTLCQTGKEMMYIPKVAALLKAMIAGKYYKKGLGDFTTLCVNAKAIKKLGYALMPFNADNTAAQKDLDKLQQAYIKAQGDAGLHTKVADKGPLSVFEYLSKRQNKIAGDTVTTDVRKIITDAITALPTITGTQAANLTAVKAKVATALKGWDKYATPVAGEMGFPCGKTGEGETAARPKDNCKSTKDAAEKILTLGCCSAVVPYKDLSAVEDKSAEFVNTVDGHMEVCVISKDDKPATIWEPVEFVALTTGKFNAQCIEGAIKAAAGAAAVVGSIFMMQ